MADRAVSVLCRSCGRVGPEGEACVGCGRVLDEVPDAPPAAPQCPACGATGDLASLRACPSCGLTLPYREEETADTPAGGRSSRVITAIAGALVVTAALLAAVIVFGAGPGELERLWRLQAGSVVVGGPRLDGDDLYLATRAGSVVAVDAATGDARWRFETGERAMAEPVIAGGLVYVSTDKPDSTEGTVFAIDTRTGAEQWRFATDVAKVGAPVVAAGAVYLSGGDVIALDAGTGEIRWRQAVDNAGVLSAGPDVVVSANAGSATGLDPATGALRWSLTATGSIQTPLAVVGEVVVVDDGAGLVAGLGAADGDQRWQAPAGVLSQPPAAGGNLVLVVTANEVVALDARSGQRRWDDGRGGDDLRLATDGARVVSVDGGRLAMLDAGSGDVLGEASIDAEAAAVPTVASGRAYVALGDTIEAFAPPDPS